LQSRDTNKIGIQCARCFYLQGIAHDARSYDLKKVIMAVVDFV
jgi:hypothetical protein